MTVTEEEAKKKWCPMFRVSVRDGGFVTNRLSADVDIDNLDVAARCIGTKCMWWVHEFEFDQNDRVEIKAIPSGRGSCGGSRE